VRLLPHGISSAAPSAARSPLRMIITYCFTSACASCSATRVVKGPFVNSLVKNRSGGRESGCGTLSTGWLHLIGRAALFQEGGELSMPVERSGASPRVRGGMETLFPLTVTSADVPPILGGTPPPPPPCPDRGRNLAVSELPRR